jgi:oligopeptide/dipeptide ABC transporter ATP-binding protein
MADRVLVMYLGQAVEECSSTALYDEPLHPYTRALIASIPAVDPDQERSAPLEGEIPSPLNPPSGCRFRTRCPVAMDICAVARPSMHEERPGHFVACHLYGDSAAATAAPAVASAGTDGDAPA